MTRLLFLLLSVKLGTVLFLRYLASRELNNQCQRNKRMIQELISSYMSLSFRYNELAFLSIVGLLFS